MGLIIKVPRPNDSCWIMSTPHCTPSESLILPTRTIFKSAEYNHRDDIPIKDNYTYSTTWLFENGVTIVVYNTGLKIGYKFLSGYFLAQTSGDLMTIMDRLAYPEKHQMALKRNFNYDWYRNVCENLKKDKPELLI